MRPETAVTSERHHRQTGCKLSANRKTEVKTDMTTNWSESSAPGDPSERFEQSVLGEASIVRPETAVMSDRHHKQTGCNLSARPTLAIVIVRKTDVNSDISTEWSEISAPRNLSEQTVLGERSSV